MSLLSQDPYLSLSPTPLGCSAVHVYRPVGPAGPPLCLLSMSAHPSGSERCASCDRSVNAGSEAHELLPLGVSGRVDPRSALCAQGLRDDLLPSTHGTVVPSLNALGVLLGTCPQHDGIAAFASHRSVLHLFRAGGCAASRQLGFHRKSSSSPTVNPSSGCPRSGIR